MNVPPGPTSCALGNSAFRQTDARHLCTRASFVSATIYHPHPIRTEHSSIVLVGGWGCGERSMAAWGPFYASHGFVAMTIGTPSPFKDMPAQRCQALLDAVEALQAENDR